ncbi:hypothetical protein GJAV_G00076520 [Gymnothorax javanicus]|nr:hypothetical protein GJAV_G00076520 [Gymnothorax javanicus]
MKLSPSPMLVYAKATADHKAAHDLESCTKASLFLPPLADGQFTNVVLRIILSIGFFGPTLNSFIHVLMYSYYGLSTIPSMHRYLWWKRYLTQAQLVQFVLTITHTLSAVVAPCGFPIGCLLFQSSYMTTLVILFVNFYIQTYKKQWTGEEKLPALLNDMKKGHSNGYSTSMNGSKSKSQ